MSGLCSPHFAPSGVSTALMFLLGILDFLFVSHAYHSILTRGASVQLVFGFEVKLVRGTKLRRYLMCYEQSYKCFLRTCYVSTPYWPPGSLCHLVLATLVHS